MNAGRSLARDIAFLLALLLLSGCGSGQPPTTRQATATLPPGAVAATQTAIETSAIGPQPTPISGLLAPAPTNCPASPPLQKMTQDNFGGGFVSPASFLGDAPVWEQGIGQSGETLHLNQYSGAVPLPGTKVLWVVGPNFAQPVTLSGQEIQTGAPIWFQVYPPNLRLTSEARLDTFYGTSAILDPTEPNRGGTDNSTGHWNIYGIGMVMLAAGCYQLDVSWSGGSWHTIYAVGR